MKNQLLAFLFATLGLTFCEAPLQAETLQEIRVQLDTASSLSPIYLSKFHLEDNSLSVNYLKELEKVAQYDFNYNGRTKTIESTSEKDASLMGSKNLKSLQAPYAISFTVKAKTLSCKLYLLNAGQVKTFADIPLTGTLAQDRVQIHKLSDNIHKSLFGVEGIANTRILYSYQHKNSPNDSSWNSEIVECDWDGANLKPITQEKSYCVTPVLIPKNGDFNKDLFLYVSYKTGQPKIFIASLEDGKGKKAVDIRGNQILPAISNQRDKLAFICDASGRTDLFIQPISPETGKMGTPVQLFSYPRATQASPTFSPDGTKIAFVSDKDGAARIYQISSQPTGKRGPAQLLTKKSRESSCPAWSPDGTKLAYSAKTENIRQIWIYDFSTGEEKQLTSGPGNKENPCWAANSLHIVFNSTDGNSSDLYVVNLNQPESVKITKGQGKKHYPTWGLR